VWDRRSEEVYSFGGAEVRALVAEDSPEVDRAVDSLSRGGWVSSWLGKHEVPRLVLTVYYPYYFHSWKVVVSRSFGRTTMVRLFTGVNGMSRSTGPTEDWPVVVERDLEGERVIPPRTSGAEAGELAREYAEKFVYRRYRPARLPVIEEEDALLIYVPYYVYAKTGQRPDKAALVEGFTGSVGRVRDVPEVLEATTLALATAVESAGEKGRFR
jgi:hypothetical protein